MIALLSACGWLFPEPPEVVHGLDDADRAVVIDGRDLQVLLPDFVPEDEVWEKWNQGPHWQVTYGSLGDPFVTSTFSLHPHPADLLGIAPAMEQLGWTFESRPELVSVGEAHTCGLLLESGAPVGNACAVLDAGRVWTVVIETDAITAPGAFDPLFAEALRTAAGYHPTPSPLTGATP